MPRLFSYCIPYDDGAAPNPYWGLCTLTICKPVIRRVAEPGDWVVATGSARHGFENKVIYAMEVTQKLTMKEYDTFCKSSLLEKIPDWGSSKFERRVGDCIYDFSTAQPTLRRSKHNELNRNTDLNGQFALLSDHFYYFGSQPRDLPRELLPIVLQGQGHRSSSNDVYLLMFIDWISKQTTARNRVLAEPFLKQQMKGSSGCRINCAEQDRKEDDLDERIGDEIKGKSNCC